LWSLIDPAHPTPLGRPLTDPTSGVSSVAFSPDGHTFAASSDNPDPQRDAGSVRLWDLDIGHIVHRICTTTSGQLTSQQWEVYIPQLPYDPPCSHYS